MSCGRDDPGPPALSGDHPAARGLAALRAGDARAALAWFERLVEQEPGGLPGHFLRAEALDRLGEHEAVQALLDDLIARFPFTEGACRERLALLALRRGDRDAAVEQLERALAAGWVNASAVIEDPAFLPYAADRALASIVDRARANALRGAD